MFKVDVKKDNIDKHDEVYTVLKFSDDEDLTKQYRPPPSEDTCIDSVAENDVIFISNTPAKRSISESESSVVEVDDDPNAQLSSTKVNRVIKKEKIT
ncbi:hypothetical protein BC332_18381 [Capsicum chinense]|nr:hypothetical protein BC332_18381 [Capsicum chinense]